MPGASVPLHLFEPRYRAMLRDVKDTTRVFGLIMPPRGAPEEMLPAGRIGCIAEISALDLLPDGRANIIVTGTQRFRFETFLDIGTPYRVGHVSEHEDHADDPVRTAVVAAQVQQLATRAIRASMVLQDLTADVPELPDDPSALSFQVAHMLQVDPELQYDMLAGRNPLTRLVQLEATIRAGLPDLEDAADRHARERGDGPASN